MKNLKLKGAIVSEGYTYEQLAKAVKVSTPTIQKAVNGGNISLQTASSIASILNRNLTELFGGE